jgi:hypothetical protein
MRLRSIAVLAWWLSGLCLPGVAAAGTSVKVIGTWPAGNPVTLGRNQNFYLRLAYATDQPVHLWAEPYYQGRPADAGSNPSRQYTGSGEALGWFFLMHPGDRVDEVRILAGNGRADGTHVLATYRVDVTASDQPVAATEPAWVARMNRQDRAAQQQAYASAENKPMSVGDTVLFNGFMLVVLAGGLAGLLRPAWAVWRWRDGWRLAAMLPLGVMAFVVLRIVFGGLRDPTSHNLWPFEIVLAGVPCLVVMGVLQLARRLVRAGRR